MKNLNKNLFPEIHVNPINRDLLVVLSIGLLASAIVLEH